MKASDVYAKKLGYANADDLYERLSGQKGFAASIDGLVISHIMMALESLEQSSDDFDL